MERTFLRDETNGSMSFSEVVKIGGKVSDSCVILLATVDIGAGMREVGATLRTRRRSHILCKLNAVINYPLYF